jgi:hypothetical protein
MVWLGGNALLFLCVARDADRTGRVFGGVIAPDVAVKTVEGRDAVLEAAVDWLGEVSSR